MKPSAASALPSRRDCLKAGVLALSAPLFARTNEAPAGAPVKIDRIELFPVRYPMTGYFKFFAAPDGRGGRATILVKVTQSDGLVGWGQSVPIPKWSYETLETVTSTLQRSLVPMPAPRRVLKASSTLTAHRLSPLLPSPSPANPATVSTISPMPASPRW